EAGPVQPALDREAVDLAFGQRHGGVRAPVADREDLSLGLHDRDLVAAEHHADRAAVLQVSDGTRPDELAHASSSSMAAVMRSSSSGIPIRATSSPKKPRSTSRRASSRGMPRDRR